MTEQSEQQYPTIGDAIRSELNHAYAKHGRDAWGRHEFYGVLKEEVDELWDAIKTDLPQEQVLSEVLQIACVCQRYIETGDRYRGQHPPLEAASKPVSPAPPKESREAMIERITQEMRYDSHSELSVRGACRMLAAAIDAEWERKMEVAKAEAALKAIVDYGCGLQTIGHHVKAAEARLAAAKEAK